MAHLFDRSRNDPYAKATREVESSETITTEGYERDAEQMLYDILSNAIVTALGDVGAQALRQGVTGRDALRGLARAVARSSEDTLLAYAGEVDPEPALRALETDPRRERLTAEDLVALDREIGKTRQLEMLLLDARRLPDLLDYAGELGLHLPDETAESGARVLENRSVRP
ncbi:MAG TPA: hypothetical protein VF221_02620 [Chloroflexota bacterium]